jgi:8-oxo-dGTP diphosphatase
VYVVRVVGAAIVRHGRCLVAQRGAQMSSAGKWEFPGGKVEPGERPEDALAREIAEELGIVILVGPWIGRGEARARRSVIVLDVYAAELTGGEPHPTEHAELRWLKADELSSLDWAEADVPILPSVAAWLGS